MHLGTKADGWTRERAQTELRHVLADVERGIWQPPVVEPVQEPAEVPEYRARLEPAPEALVFGTANGKPAGATNVRRRILAKAVEHANGQLAKDKTEQLPAGLSPHSLRRTFASLLFAVGETPPYVMAQMAHTTANLTLSIYAGQMHSRDGEPERLKALVEGREWVATGSGDSRATSERLVAEARNASNGQ